MAHAAALLLSALFGGRFAGAARIQSSGGLQVAAAGQLLRDRYVLEEFLERRNWPFVGGGGGWPFPGGGWPGQVSPTPAPAPAVGGVPGQSFPDIERRNLSSPEHLGTGSFGDVWSAKDTVTGQRVAVKIFYTKSRGSPRYLTWKNAKSADLAEFKSAQKECDLVKQIMAYKDSYPVGASRICECYEEHVSDAEGTNKPVFLVMEMCGQSLTKNFINKHKQGRSVDVPGARTLAQHMLEGLDFMSTFSPPLIHHDLKPDNVVVTADGQLKIIDWGALVLGDPRNVNQRTAATPLYTPPEASQGRRAFSMPAHSYDVYAVGLMYMEMLCPALDYQTWYYSRPLSFSKVSSLVKRACPSLPQAQIAADLELIGAMVDSTPSRRPEPSVALESSAFGGSSSAPQAPTAPPQRGPMPFQIGEAVEYRSSGTGRWYEGRIARFNAESGTYDIVHPGGSPMKSGADPARIRRLTRQQNAVPQEYLLPVPEADDADSDPITGSHVFDPTEVQAPVSDADLPLSTELELLPPKVYGGLGMGGVQVHAIVAGAQPSGTHWSFEQCILRCNSVAVEMEMSNSASMESYSYAQFSASIDPGSSRCSMYAVATRASGGLSERVRSPLKSFTLVRSFWR